VSVPTQQGQPDESGNTSSTAFLAIDWKADWEKVCAERDGLVVERDRYRDALAEAVRVIEGLAEQQAMPDDWYEVPLARLKELVALKGDEA
jgi:hypothetical protein